jgi:hypothetical protein
MEQNPQNNKPSINFTLIIIVAIFCTSVLFGIFLLNGKNADNKKAFGVLKSEVPLYISWRETEMPGSHTKVAMIWPKSDAPLPLRIGIEILDSSTGKQYYMEKIVEPMYTSKKPLEVGGFLSYQFVSGDKITITNNNYSSIESTCR